MDIKAVQQLADLMEKKDLASLEYCEGELKINLVRAIGVQPVQSVVAPVAVAPVAAPVAPVAAAPVVVAPQEAAPAGEELTSPLVGIGYTASGPSEAPFVSLGSKVKKGQVLCIIESMKVMNEYTAPRAGTVTDICFENGQLLEFGQVIFRLQ